MNYKLISSRLLLLAALALGAINTRAQNPISPMGVYIADPTARVMPDGKLYIYGSLDMVQKSYCSSNYHVMSTDDLCNWQLHRNAFSWNETLYAPDMMLKDGVYYLYFDTPNGDEFVAMGNTPVGPFLNAVKIEGPRQIDPNIFIDDDGQAYYFWGQFSAKGARMNPDLKTLDQASIADSVVTERDHWFHEGSYVVKRGKYYYFTYADISRNGRPTCIGYSMSTSPLGPYEYKGVIVDNSGCDPETWNNHGSLVEYKGQWYVLYHRATHGCNTMRKACIEPITFNDDGTINEVEMTSQGAGPPLDARQNIDAARACLMQGHVRIQRKANDSSREHLGEIRPSDKAAWKYLDFGKKSPKYVTLQAKAPQGGTVTLHADSPDGRVIATVSLTPSQHEERYLAKCAKTTGIHALWMEFTDVDGNATTAPAQADSPAWSIDGFRFAKDKKDALR